MKKIFLWFLKILGILLFIFSLVLAFIAIFKKEFFLEIIEWIRLIVVELWPLNYLLIFISSLIEAFPVLWIFVPWQNILMIVWGFYWQDFFWQVVFFASIWGIIWNYIGYILGYYYWDYVLDNYGIYTWIWRTESDYIKKWLWKYGPIAIVFSKFHPTFRAFIPFLVWHQKMKHKLFMFYNSIWSIIWWFSMVYIWTVFVENYEVILNYIWRIILWLILIYFAYIFIYKRDAFTKYLQLREQEIYGKK